MSEDNSELNVKFKELMENPDADWGFTAEREASGFKNFGVPVQEPEQPEPSFNSQFEKFDEDSDTEMTQQEIIELDNWMASLDDLDLAKALE
jgi:hypothetical protein